MMVNKAVFSMGKTVLFVGVSLAFALPALPGLAAYSTNVGSVSWRNQGGYVYDSIGVLFTGDDFDGPEGSELTSPPYDSFEYPPITCNGDGTISLIGTDEEIHQEVKLPNFDSSGNWLTAYDADFVVNFQTGTPPLGYGFSVEIDTEGFEPAEDDMVILGVYTFPFPDGVQCGLFFFDDNTEGSSPLTLRSLSDLGIEGFSSLGLRLSVDSDGICTPYYWPNPDDGILGFDDQNWLQLGSATSQLDMSKQHDDISFQINNGGAILPGSIDIDPDTLNLRSKARWIRCYISLPEGYDVADIVPESILLKGELNGEVAPDRCRVHKAKKMLIVRFYRSEVQAIVEPGEEVELTVSGELTDGTKFEGSDTITVID